MESSTHACWPTELDHPATIKDIKPEGEMQKEGERERRSAELNETDMEEVNTTEGHTLVGVLNHST